MAFCALPAILSEMAPKARTSLWKHATKCEGETKTLSHQIGCDSWQVLDFCETPSHWFCLLVKFLQSRQEHPQVRFRNRCWLVEKWKRRIFYRLPSAWKPQKSEQNSEKLWKNFQVIKVWKLQQKLQRKHKKG